MHVKTKRWILQDNKEQQIILLVKLCCLLKLNGEKEERPHTWVAVCVVARIMRKVDEPGFWIQLMFPISSDATKHTKKALPLKSFYLQLFMKNVIQATRLWWFYIFGG